MKLVISEVARERQLAVDVESLAKSYGLQGSVTARLIFDDVKEFLDSVDDTPVADMSDDQYEAYSARRAAEAEEDLYDLGGEG